MPSASPLPDPPVAERRRHVRRVHGDEMPDPWQWLRHRDDPAVIAHLHAENEFTQQATAHLADLRETIFQEIKARVEEDDETAPFPFGGWLWWRRTTEGRQYAEHLRRPVGGGDPEVFLDENALAEGHDYLSVPELEVDPRCQRLGYLVDTEGREQHELRIRDLATGEDLADRVEGAYYGLGWSNDGEWIFYTTTDEALRPHRVWRHRVGTEADEDVLVHEEADERFWLGIAMTRSRRFLQITAESKTTSEVRLLPLDEPAAEPRPVWERRDGVEYSVADHDGRLFVTTNLDAVDFRVLECDMSGAVVDEVLPHRPGVRVHGCSSFAGHLAVWRRQDAVMGVSVIDLVDRRLREVTFDDPVHTVEPYANAEWDTADLLVSYSSFVRNTTTVRIDMRSLDRQVVKEKSVLGGYSPDDYVTERRWVTSGDVDVPVSVVRRRDTPLDGTAPCLLYGYGSYEISTDPWFSYARVSLLDRGWVFVVAHVRGGGEMGRAWYDHGHLEHKINTFRDFVAVAESITGEVGPLAIRGGSAGGLLVGAAVTMRPELFDAVIADVPFVDVVSTMLDATIPLTVVEWEEWGNPSVESEYRWILEYSPYDNTRPADYPPMLVMAGLTDPRVQYWEPAKWVQKLRSVQQGDGQVLLKTEMGAGHFGPSGRYDAWRDEAFVLSWLLDAMNAAAPDEEALSSRG